MDDSNSRIRMMGAMQTAIKEHGIGPVMNDIANIIDGAANGVIHNTDCERTIGNWTSICDMVNITREHAFIIENRCLGDK